MDPSIRHKAVLKVKEVDFVGEGRSKKFARVAAARSALLNNFGIDPDTYVEPPSRLDYLQNSDTEPPHECPAEVKIFVLFC